MVFLGAGMRLLVILLVIVALAAIPLLTVHRARCRSHGKHVNRWYWVAPGKDAKRRGCFKEQNGLAVLLGQVGVKT